MSLVTRYDQINLDELKLKETSEGYLEGFAIATRVGVFPYVRADGSVQRELRLPEEVFKDDSINSFKLQPITNDHPSQKVDAENAKNLTVGITGQEVKKDEKFLAPYVKIMDKDAVAAVKAGKRGLSFGYTVTLEKADGVYNGERYDYIQRNIKGNHLAIVFSGRAGESAKLRLDGQDAICVFNNNFNDNQQKMLKKYRLDEKEFEVAEEVAAKLDSFAAEISSLKDTCKEAKQKCDALEGERDALKSKVEAESKKDHSAELAEKVKSKVALISKAGEILKSDEDLSGLSEREIHAKVISAIHPESKFDGKSDEYVAARFDTICDFRKDEKLAKSFEIASENKDSGEEKFDSSELSNAALQNGLIKRTTNKKGE
jgi:hypothetical protein